MYLWLALFFFIIGGLEAMLIRAQLAVGDNDLISPEFYNQLFTMHGTTMIFLVLMPALIGLATYLIPLMIGANEMAFPRLNAFSFWMTCLGGFLMYFSFFAGGAPDAGWFNYAPLSESNYSSTQGVDYYLVGLILTGMGSIGAGLNFVTTILTLRSPDIKLNMLPLFAWMIFINGFLILAAFPLLNAGLFMMLIDRQFDAHFFIPSSGGSAILWQHFFWSFGHPEVYILALPAFGIISEVIPVFSRNKIFGYKFVAASTVAIALLAFGVWVHHMFAVGMTNTVNGFFAASSMLIGIPTGVKVINWIGTLYKGSIRMTVSMMFAVAFLIDFTIGGLSGASFAIVPIDWQLTDTYYVVAHIHYVFLGGTAFGIFAGIYYWFPKISGRFLSEKLGKWHLWLFVIGFNFTFLVQHVLGILGMPRRIYTYPSRFGSWEIFNMISTLGAVMMFVAIAVFLWNLFITLKKPRTAPKNPWEAWTLEWATNSPPDLKNFEEVPRVHSRRPLWDLANPDNPDKRLN
tara:strand:+ start:61 stop:1608 length:1548 start_codon:yes stop_codon:yes gene_type:complete